MEEMDLVGLLLKSGQSDLAVGLRIEGALLLGLLRE
jgi:hypothetical protein